MTGYDLRSNSDLLLRFECFMYLTEMKRQYAILAKGARFLAALMVGYN